MSSELQNEEKKKDKTRDLTEGKAQKDDNTLRKVSPKFRLWLELNENASLEEDEDRSLLGKGGALLLEKIAETGSISDAIRGVPPKHHTRRKTGLSYRYAWGLLKKISDRLGKPIIRKFRGGRKGGGTELTDTGEEILQYYTRLEKLIQATLVDKELWEAIGLKLSYKNRLEGKVASLLKDNTAAKVNIELKIPTIIEALITTEAVDDLSIKEGDTIKVIIKSTEIYLSTL